MKWTSLAMEVTAVIWTINWAFSRLLPIRALVWETWQASATFPISPSPTASKMETTTTKAAAATRRDGEKAYTVFIQKREREYSISTILAVTIFNNNQSLCFKTALPCNTLPRLYSSRNLFPLPICNRLPFLCVCARVSCSCKFKEFFF